ncbi:tetratricopeptide repeat protein [Thermodesulfobacteriota bacterium]
MKKRASLIRHYILLVTILTVFNSGCGTTGKGKTEKIPITIYKSAAIDIRSRNIGKIAVAPFEAKTVNNSDIGTKAAEALTKALKNTLIYEVKGPNEVSSDLLLNGFAIKPFMEKSELQKVGMSLKVDAFFTGEIKRREIVNKVFSKVIVEKEETGEGEFIKDDDGKLLYKAQTKEVEVDMECRSGIGEVSIRFKLYDAKTGALIFDRVETMSEEVDAFCYRANFNPEKMTSKEVAILLDEISGELSEKFVAQLTPPSKTELVVFERIVGADKFSNNLFELGIDYAKVGDWSESIKHFERCRDKNRGRSESYYNLGVAYRGFGWNEKALTEFKQAHKRSAKKIYAEAIRGTKKAIERSRKETE